MQHKTFLGRIPILRVILARQRFTSDISGLTFAQMQEMFRDIRRRARDSGQAVVPIMLENHTKDIGNFKPIEKFAAYVAKAEDIEVITSAQLAKNLRAGMYRVKTA
jgi:endonuclease III